MISRLRITILIDDCPNDTGLIAEHGLALWIEADERRMLFDTGQSAALVQNAKHLDIDLSTANALVISHGHYDHTGGAADFLALNSKVAVYCNPGIFIPRYSRQPDNSMKPIGINSKSSDSLHQIMGAIQWVTGPMWISEDIGITGPVPRKTDFEDTGGAFYLDPEGNRPDSIEDDLAIWFRIKNGLCVVTGCCHSGLVNTIDHIQFFVGNKNIRSVIGGLHLLHAASERLDRTCDYLNNSNIKQIIPLHCSGNEAIEFLMNHTGSTVLIKGLGESFVF